MNITKKIINHVNLSAKGDKTGGIRGRKRKIINENKILNLFIKP